MRLAVEGFILWYALVGSIIALNGLAVGREVPFPIILYLALVWTLFDKN